MNLIATSGNISESGSLIAGTLTGRATGSVSLFGTTPTDNQIANVGSFSAKSFALNDDGNLTIAGPVTGKSLSLNTTGDLVIAGMVNDGGNGTTALNAGGAITETGTLIAGALSGSANGAVDLSGSGPTINRIAVLSGFSGAGFTLRDSTSLTVTGALSGGPSVGSAGQRHADGCRNRQCVG